MALKWTGVIVASVAITLCLTTNVVVAVLNAGTVPAVANMVEVALAAVATVVAVLAELYERLNRRLTEVVAQVNARLDQLDLHAGDRNTGFVEGFLLSHGQDASVVPLAPRAAGRRAVTGGDD